MNAQQQLDASVASGYYENVAVGDAKFFNFPTSQFKYHEVLRGAKKLSISVLAEKYTLEGKPNTNTRAKTPFLIKLALGSGSQTQAAFLLLKDNLEQLMETNVDFCYENKVYLNASEEVYSALNNKLKDDGLLPKLLMQIEIRHVVYSTEKPRVKYQLLSAEPLPETEKLIIKKPALKRQNATTSAQPKKRAKNSKRTPATEVEELPCETQAFSPVMEDLGEVDTFLQALRDQSSQAC